MNVGRVFIIFSILLSISWRTSGQNLQSDQKAISSDQKNSASEVFHGLVVGKEVFIENSQVISDYRVFVLDVKKGTFQIGDTVVVRSKGGLFENMGHVYPGELHFDGREEGLFFLERASNHNGFAQFGMQSFSNQSIDQSEVNGIEQSIGFSPSEVIGNSGSYLSITGSGFGSQRGNGCVLFDSGSGYYSTSTAQNFEYQFWSNDSICVKIPNAVSNLIQVYTDNGLLYASTSPLKVIGNFVPEPGGIYGRIHHVNQFGGGYKFQLHTNMSQNAQARGALIDIFNKTTCLSELNFQLDSSTFNTEPVLGDGINGISFDTPVTTLPIGIEGRCNYIWSSCINNGEVFYYLSEIDLVLSRSVNWYFGTGSVPVGFSKFRYVLMHEFGHSGMLGHVNEEGETMYPVVSNLPANNWNQRDSYTEADSIGLVASLMGSSSFAFQGCGITPMVPINPVACTPVGLVEELGRPVIDISSSNVHISGLNRPTHVRISDISGRIIYEFDQRMSVSDFPVVLKPEIYFIILTDDSSISVEKRIVQF